MKGIIIENELKAKEALEKMLSFSKQNIELMGHAFSIATAIPLIKKVQPEIVFLDIELNDGNAFELLERLEKIQFKIIFTTAYNQFAIEAFKYSAMDYLLKPIDPVDLEQAIERSAREIHLKKDYQKAIHLLAENKNNQEKQITLITTEQTHFVPLQEIVRLEAKGSYTEFITINKRILISKNLKYYQDLFKEQFIRCHHAHLVNKKYISSLNKANELSLTNQDIVAVSTRKRAEVLKVIRS